MRNSHEDRHFERFGLNVKSEMASPVFESQGRRHLLRAIEHKHVLAAIAKHDD